MLQNSPVFQEHNNGESVFSHRAAASPHLHWENRERKKNTFFVKYIVFYLLSCLEEKCFPAPLMYLAPRCGGGRGQQCPR